MANRPLAILGVAIFTAIVLGMGVLTEEDQAWEARLKRDAALSLKRSSLGEETLAEAQRRKANAQWQLAEFYFGQAQFDSAAVEYSRLIRDFPYSMDYGYRADDANLRLALIRRMQQNPDAPVPVYLGGSDAHVVDQLNQARKERQRDR